MRSLAIAAVGVLVGTSAFAADLGVAAKAPPPVMMQSYDWSGFYIGAQGGYAFGRSDAVFSDPAFAPSASQKYDIDGGMAGGLIGWNYQFAGTPWVIGLEADINWANIRGRSGLIVNPGDHYDTRVDWYGTVRGRLGYAWGQSLLYATGGLAYGEVRTRYVNPEVLNDDLFSVSETRTGYTVGAGWEWMFASNWTLRAEYNYVNLGKQTLLIDGPEQSTRFENDFHVVKGAITYKFGGGPVVARY